MSTPATPAAPSSSSTTNRHGVTERRPGAIAPRWGYGDPTAAGDGGCGGDTAPGGSLLVGTPAAAGRATGRARVLRAAAPAVGASLGSGEILVVPALGRQWLPLLAAAGGVVAEADNVLAIPVTLARDYGVPAVLGVRCATARIATGQRVTVDGTAGIVSRRHQGHCRLIRGEAGIGGGQGVGDPSVAADPAVVAPQYRRR